MVLRCAAFAEDHSAISAAISQIRDGFRESAQVTDPGRIAALCDEALDAADFINSNVAQARLTERGTYRACVDRAEHCDLRPPGMLHSTLSHVSISCPQICQLMSGTEAQRSNRRHSTTCRRHSAVDLPMQPDQLTHAIKS